MVCYCFDVVSGLPHLPSQSSSFRKRQGDCRHTQEGLTVSKCRMPDGVDQDIMTVALEAAIGKRRNEKLLVTVRG